jgi:hypothetical protein
MFSVRFRVTCVLACAMAGNSFAATVYNEALSGDLSNAGLTPSAIAVGSGSNQIFGTTGRGTTVDRDYFSFTIPAGFELSRVLVLAGTESAGVAFLGLEAGSQVTLSTSPSTAAGLLGWWHYGPADIGTDILAEMGTAGNGAAGFVPPLPAGTYSVWIQELSAGSYAYGFDLVVTPTPEPGTAAEMLIGLGLTGAWLGPKYRMLRRP